MRYGLVIDLLKCMGCHACALACKAEQGTPKGISYNNVRMTEVGRYPDATCKFLPVSCMHCGEPKCVTVCPTEATYKRDNGIVVIEHKKCVGCGACVLACPYGSRTLLEEIKGYYEGGTSTPYEMKKYREHETGKAVKCNFCTHRIERGQLPACVATCPALARTFGDLDDPESDVSKLLKRHKPVSIKEQEQTEPSIFYIRL
jgi:molybdopterin-containing oxidoreductase family iron-sulfur binding subunit